MRFSLQALAYRVPAMNVGVDVKSRQREIEKASELWQQSAQASLN